MICGGVSVMSDMRRMESRTVAEYNGPKTMAFRRFPASGATASMKPVFRMTPRMTAGMVPRRQHGELAPASPGRGNFQVPAGHAVAQKYTTTARKDPMNHDVGEHALVGHPVSAGTSKWPETRSEGRDPWIRASTTI
jgi:hypothetical protein